MTRVLVTGAAGFIGFHVARRLCADGHDVLGFDNLNDYYDPALKQSRLKELGAFKNFMFVKGNLADTKAVNDLFTTHRFETIIHLAAQPGVRYSLINPHAYTESNITGFLNILEGCRHNKVGHLIFASSSSVYGNNEKQPFAITDNVDHPVSLYAATKKANELMAHSYAHLYGLPCTGLRFFTVYGPWGRPDMAVYKFTDQIFKGEKIDVYNHGDMMRDFTYIDDIAEGVIRLIPRIPQTSGTPYKLYNIGNNKPENLRELISLLEKETGIKAKLNLLPMQPGDVKETFADIDDLTRDTGFKPSTSLAKGIKQFIRWYRAYHSNGPQ